MTEKEAERRFMYKAFRSGPPPPTIRSTVLKAVRKIMEALWRR